METSSSGQSTMRGTVVFPMLGLSRSGGVRIVCALANELARREVPVRMYAPHAHCPFELHGGVELVGLGPGQRGDLSYMLRLIGRMRGDDGVAVSTGYLTPALIHASNVVFGRPVRMFSVIQGYEPESLIRYGRRPSWMKFVLTWLAQLGYILPGRKIAVSRYVAERVGRDRIHAVINTGIRDEFVALAANATPAPTDGNTVGLFPYPDRNKGARYVAEAVGSLRARGGSVELLACDIDLPAPTYAASYRAIAAEQGVEASIVDFYRRCDVFLFPSLSEGFGLPPLEAMACGTPVIATDSGGTREYACDGDNALVVPAADAVALSNAIERVLNDAELRERLVAGGLATAPQFSEHAFVERAADEIERYLLG